MTPQHHGLAHDIRTTAAPVDPAKQSNTKWKPVAAVVAEALGLPAADVYGVTISKPGNVSVRATQSPGGRATPVVLLMYTGRDAELERSITATRKHCATRDLALTFVRDTQGWTLVSILKQPGAPVPPALAAEYPTASVEDL
jgi:hypothetical protein